MKKIRLYGYNKCSTCKKAEKFLNARNISYEAIPIIEEAPTKEELLRMLDYYEGQLKKIFNTSGVVYREMELGKKIKSMGVSEAVDLLSSEGRLVKRPFIISETFGLVGFKEEEWKEKFPS